MIDFIRYDLWPQCCVRLRYAWWVVKYRGKKNIPRDVVMGAMAESMKRMNDNLMAALGTMPKDTSEEDRRTLIELLQKAAQLEDDVRAAEKERKQ